MKYAAVYKIKSKLIFCSNAETTDGVGLSIPPYIQVESDAPSEDIAALAGIVAWIYYWVQLSRYKKKLKERALKLNY